jgi:hypothetical protein
VKKCLVFKRNILVRTAASIKKYCRSSNKHTTKVIKKKINPEQALQIIGHVVAKSYANKCSIYGRRRFAVSNRYFITFTRMGNLPVLLPNATPLVSRFLAEMSKKRQF